MERGKTEDPMQRQRQRQTLNELTTNIFSFLFLFFVRFFILFWFFCTYGIRLLLHSKTWASSHPFQFFHPIFHRQNRSLCTKCNLLLSFEQPKFVYIGDCKIIWHGKWWKRKILFSVCRYACVGFSKIFHTNYRYTPKIYMDYRLGRVCV